MGSISHEQVKWAVIDRLGRMLRMTSDPNDEFDVTHAFALFSGICAWVRQRIGNYASEECWPPGMDDLKLNITDPIWGLPSDAAGGKTSVHPFKERRDQAKGKEKEKGVPIELPNRCAWYFFVWVRNAMSHADDRTIEPVHTWVGGRETLTGYCFSCQGGYVTLSGDIMRRLGTKLADVYCAAFSGGPEFDAGARDVREKIA
jgi:hypothetical protein